MHPYCLILTKVKESNRLINKLIKPKTKPVVALCFVGCQVIGQVKKKGK